MIHKPNQLDAFWMPYTPNRHFKKNPRILVKAEGMYYENDRGEKILDAAAGLWCVNAGHGQPKIINAIQQQVAELDYATCFQMGHPKAFELANRLSQKLPWDFDHVFYVNSGSEAVDTALKIALAYHHLRGEGSRMRLIGREKAYHGVNFGGVSVGGIGRNRMRYGPGLQVDHLPHTLSLEYNAFSKGEPHWGLHLADDLERLVMLHDASSIAAVIVEPVSGSSGVIVPPKGYLKRLREICDKYGILLIFDEVITGFGRLGHWVSAEYFDVMPDIITVAKGITNGTVPLGAVFVRKGIYDTFMQGPEEMVEFFHGYTCAGSPLPCAAALATMEVYEEENLFDRAKKIMPHFEKAVHSLCGEPHVVDIRNLGLMAGIEFAPRKDQPISRAMEVFLKCYEEKITMRYTGDVIALSPPLIVETWQIDEMIDTLRRVIQTIQ